MLEYNYLTSPKKLMEYQKKYFDNELQEADIESLNWIEYENEKIKVEFKDYYFSNVVARASKTMFECNNSKLVLKKTGTEG